MVKIFKNEAEAKEYGRKNYFEHEIKETRNGNFVVIDLWNYGKMGRLYG